MIQPYKMVAAPTAITSKGKRGVPAESLFLGEKERRSNGRFLFISHWLEQDHTGTLKNTRDKGRIYFIIEEVAMSNKTRILLVRKKG